MVNNKLICFDVDGTLVEDKSSWITLTEGLGCSPQKVLPVYMAAMSGSISFSEGEKMVAGFYSATGKATKSNIEKIFSKMVFRESVFDIMDFLKNRGYSIWLVSGAIDIHVAAVAKRVAADGFYASASLEFDGRESLSKINYGGLQSLWKAQKVRDLAKKYAMPPGEIIFVGDGENDIDAFKVARGIAIAPCDARLEAIAWRKLMSLSEIKDIIE